MLPFVVDDAWPCATFLENSILTLQTDDDDADECDDADDAAADDDDDLYIIGAVCLSVWHQNAYFPYSKVFVVFPVCRHFPYSRYLVISPVYRHHIPKSV